MTRYLPFFAAVAMSLMSSTFVSSLKASEWDKKTIITISQPIAVEGTILPAGQYVLKLQDSQARLDVVYIFDREETRLITAVQAIHAERLQPTDKSEFSFYDLAEGQPAALHTWFYPGEESGFEFLQPRNTAAAKSSGAVAAAIKTQTQSPQHPAATPLSAAGK